MAGFLVGVDIGGTFTDCVVVSPDGTVTTAKAPSTPPDFSGGFVAALELAAGKLGKELRSFCAEVSMVSHGTTIGTNTLIQRKGAKVGLITTKGHEDAIHIMRGSRGYSGREIRKVVHFSEGSKPVPIVPKRMIAGISERVDYAGREVVPLNDEQVNEAIDRLLAAGAEAFAVCLLWSFKNPSHEQRVVRLIRARAPGAFVTCSSDLVPKWGEYERTTAVALNANIGPVTSAYLRRLDERLKSLGYQHPLQITQCGGGLISVQKATEAPLLTLDSGPVSGVTGSVFLGKLMGEANIITTDMGGTSFDVGVIYGGEASTSHLSSVNQYEYFLPKVDIQTIGAGGGSLARFDPVTNSLHVGPESAGAQPGPVCYGRGGTIPTVTDADLFLGYFDAENFAGGSMKLDYPAAAAAITSLAQQLNLSPVQCAEGIARIASFNMADLIRRTTIQKGFDPRDFVLFAFGGAGPVHAGVFAAELGVKKVIVPQKKTASVWCAFGAAAADVLHVYETVDMMTSPFDLGRINANLAQLQERGAQQLRREGIAAGRYSFSCDVRHRGQINEVEVSIAAAPMNTPGLEALIERFYERYELIYGKGSSFRGVKLEVVSFRCKASAEMPKPVLNPSALGPAQPDGNAIRAHRKVYWGAQQNWLDTRVYDGDLFKPGNSVDGPAIVETTDTTVVVHEGQKLAVDRFGNFELSFDQSSGRSVSGQPASGKDH